ncbi:sensor histidine kinase [Catenulispora subtropica]|uniref:histidine kinase n=1 Tax=Catenulispora subtropica TaxID=450798 RepID=A0ABN2T631_9ACTN
MAVGASALITVADVLAAVRGGQTDPIMMTGPGDDFPDLRRWTERRPAAAVALRLGGLLLIGVTLVKSGQHAAWPLAAVAIAAAVVWTLSASRHLTAAVPAAIVFGLCGAVMAGMGWGEPAGLTFVFMAMLYLQAVGEPRVVALSTGVALLVVGTFCALVADRAADLPWIIGVTFGGALLGDVRRSRMLALRRAQELLAMTRRANAEQAHAAALAERGRIARDVHDVLAHSLSGLAIQLEAADALLTEGGDVDAAHTMVVRARRLARDGLAEVRRAVAALREDVKPPEETLAKLVADYGADTGWKATFELVGGPVPALEVETAQGLQRVAQEALTNARKHAPGAPVEVRLSVGVDTVTLTVANDAPTAASAPLADSGGGWGIVGLRERVELLGGTLTAEATERGGWQVIATVPIVISDIFQN